MRFGGVLEYVSLVASCALEYLQLWLDRAEVNTNNLRFRVFIGCISFSILFEGIDILCKRSPTIVHCPYTRSSSDVEEAMDFEIRIDWTGAQFAIVGQRKCMMLQIWHVVN